MYDIIRVLYWLLFVSLLAYSAYRGRFVMNWIMITTAVALHAFLFYSWGGLIFIVVTAVVSTIAELVSLRSRFNCFGVVYRYNLNDRLFPSRISIMGVYPVEVVAAWVFLKYISFFMIDMIALRFGIGPFVRAFMCAAALTSFDLLIDPVAVGTGAWKWGRSGWFFGIPWQNFLGWYIVGLVVSLLFTGLNLQGAPDFIMVFPILFIWSLFPFVWGIRLFTRNKFHAVLGMLPSIFFLLLGVYTIIW